MFRRKGRILSSALALFCCLTFFAGGVLAADQSSNPTTVANGGMQVLYVNTDYVSVNLDLNETAAYCNATVVGKPGSGPVTATVTLSRQTGLGTYTTVKTWSGLSSANNILSFSDTYYVATGYTYRLRISATVYMGDIGELVSATTYNSN